MLLFTIYVQIVRFKNSNLKNNQTVKYSFIGFRSISSRITECLKHVSNLNLHNDLHVLTLKISPSILY